MLLHLLAAYRQNHPAAPPLHAIHVNHQLQEAATDWAAHCQRQCDALGISLTVQSVQVDTGKASLEAAAREARFACFESLLGDGDVLLLAHHLDDQVETFFLRALRGAGASGLAGMPPMRLLGRAVLLRPLLGAPQGALQDYATYHKLAFVDDPSNHSAQFDRSYLRTEVLPLFEARWPAYRQTISRAMGHLRDMAPDTPMLTPCCSVLGDPGVSVAGIASLTDAQLSQALRSWLSSEGLMMPNAAALGEFVRQLRLGDVSHARLQTSAWLIQHYDDAVYRLPPETDLPGSTTVAPGKPCPWAGRELALVPCAVGEVGILPEQALSLTARRGGERCRLHGHSVRRPLKKILQELRVPPWWRERLPLVYAGDELVAIADLQWCDSALVGKTQPGERRFSLVWRRGN